MAWLHPYMIVVLRVTAILVGAFVLTLVLNRLIRGIWASATRMLQNRKSGAPNPELQKQAATIAGIVHKSVGVLIYAFAVITALRELGYDIRPLLAGAGVLGLAIGFGAQNLVRDVIGGFFILIENQIRVNDVVVINDTAGAVEEINLRTTVLRDAEGTVHVFPNGSINKLANKTQEFSFYVFTIPVAYSDDVGRALELMREAYEEMAAVDRFSASILAPLEIFGVDQLGEWNVTVKARLKTLPGKQWEVGREMNRLVLARFLAAGMKVPVRSTTTVESVNSNPAVLRQLIREAVAEERDHSTTGSPK